jgi:hypothetical protein
MRSLILIPLALLAVVGGGAVVCAAAGWTLHGREMTVAAISSALVCVLALGPTFLARHAGQAAVAQAGLVGTLVHLMGHAAVAAFAIMVKPAALGPSFIWWLMPFYWVTLVALVSVLVRQLRQAPGSTAGGNK